MTDNTGDGEVADGLHELHPPYDPDDITTWSAEQLDELGVWAAAEQGLELVDEPPDPVAPHGENEPADHDHTIGGEHDPGPEVH